MAEQSPPSTSHLSIGEVLSLVHDEFPDVTISKIRFLESQGLIDPERTPSGYR
jgi:DNA-binding transcriptional MerR regulator